jgi:hypothetical protein
MYKEKFLTNLGIVRTVLVKNGYIITSFPITTNVQSVYSIKFYYHKHGRNTCMRKNYRQSE